MEESYWAALDAEIDMINNLRAVHQGSAMLNGHPIQAELDCTVDRPTLKISHIFNSEPDDCVFSLKTGRFDLVVEGMITGQQNTVNVAEGWSNRYSSGKVERIKSAEWPENAMDLYRTYYHLASNRLLYDYFGFKEAINFTTNNIEYRLTDHNDFLVAEALNPVAYPIYAEQVYNIMVALGFVTGNFIQDHNYTFVLGDHHAPQFLYRRLRQGSDSMYHALTWNAHGYKHMLGRDKAEAIANSDILKPLDAAIFGRLAELTNNQHAIQYALVLFNEANSNKLSLLIKNSCFYTVLEVLRKFFFKAYETNMPKNYSTLGNIPKFKVVFGQLAEVNTAEETMLKRRNSILHGEVDDLEGHEMINLMQMQISLIYKLLMIHVGFDGYVLDHYALRNNQPDQAFVKLN
jgi:hypothetical protein